MQLNLPVNERDRVQGPENASVTLVEYGDYECPHCGQAYLLVKQIQKQLGDRLRFVYRHFPLTTLHAYAQHAAETAEAADAQGRFWEIHDYQFEPNRSWLKIACCSTLLNLGWTQSGLSAKLQNTSMLNRCAKTFKAVSRAV